MIVACSSNRSLVSAVIVCGSVLAAACSRHSSLPAPDSKQYRDFVSAFYVGLAGLETGEDNRAQTKLTQASQIAPGEASTWANLALFAVRQQDFESAFINAGKARDLAPTNSRIEALLGVIEDRRGKLPEAILHLRKAVALDKNNLKAVYSLAEETERQGTAESAKEAQNLFGQIVSNQPTNTAAHLEVARLAAKRGDVPGLNQQLNWLVSASTTWPEEVRARVAIIRQIADGPNPRAAAVQVTFLRNGLARVPAYRRSLNAVKTPSTFAGEPFSRFLNLPTPSSEPAPSDGDLAFHLENPNGIVDREVTWAGALPLDDSGKCYWVTADAEGLQIAGGAHLPFHQTGLGRYGVLGADLNYDFKTDFVVAGPSGLRFYQQENPAKFDDVTAQTKLPASVLSAAYSGAWAFDVDLDGDLDVVLASPVDDPMVLRNNADGSFAVIHPFSGVKGVVSFASGDIDADGDPDVAMVDRDGHLHLFANERLGEFQPRPVPPTVHGQFLAVAAGDVNGDGLPDFVVLRDDGSVLRLSDKDSGNGWDVAELVKPGGPRLTQSAANLLLADFDNNGSLDILAGERIFLIDSHGLTSRSIPSAFTVTGAADLKSNGRLDLVGFRQKPAELTTSGTKNYQWQSLRVRAANAHGDQRINSFGIGGEIEIRSGLLAQKQIITSPLLHFGLGEHTQSDLARIVWPNGSVQAEFELKSNQSILAEQRLKGSCPFLFAWDGKQIRFVKDGEPWSPALGLHINAQAVANVTQTQEWFKVPGEALVPRDGYYDLRVTGELWETYYIDHYSLLVVDHPRATAIFTDERFSSPAPPLKIHTVSEPQPFACAKDDNGVDVSRIVSQTDGQYLDTFGRGRYQGVTRDHWVEVQLPESAPQNGSLLLIASGWMHPTDATINVALSQSSDPPPQGLRIEVPDAQGNWVVAQSGLGFLAGRNKTAVLDISHVFRAGAPRKLRLRTNLEIYWDQLAWATALPDAQTRVQRAPLIKADLRYRGFSTIHVANPSSPELPDYDHLEGTSQMWRDLEGYYTRYGDVRELLDQIDDRIVITNAGDELCLRFAAAAPPPSGWQRDYVMVGDGWIKDGDYNSVFSKTVLPLPYHAMKDYSRKPTALENEPAYRLHPADWETYHTRYITPEWFVKALWN